MPTFVRDIGLLVVLAVMWSSSFTAIKIGTEALPPTTFAMLRVAVGAIVLYFVLKMKRQSLPTEPRLWWSFF